MPINMHKEPNITFWSIFSFRKIAPQKIPVMGTKKIIEEACTGEDLCNKTTYAIKEMPVETNPRKKTAK